MTPLEQCYRYKFERDDARKSIQLWKDKLAKSQIERSKQLYQITQLQKKNEELKENIENWFDEQRKNNNIFRWHNDEIGDKLLEYLNKPNGDKNG